MEDNNVQMGDNRDIVSRKEIIKRAILPGYGE
jgi:hypothetical protein